VVRIEWLTQRREPLTVLYMLVFALLAAAFSSTGSVELVRGRGAVSRDSAWSLMLASSAITAFGQVITTMVAATVVLRDRADRIHELLGVTHLSPREYYSGKLLAALAMLCVIYTAIPIGLVAGVVASGGDLRVALAGCASPFLLLVLPTMLAVGAMQFAAGVLSGRLWVLVGQGLLLIWLWSWATSDAGMRAGVALVDPFGGAPTLAATRVWSDAQRQVQIMPLTPLLIANRLLWLAVGGTFAAYAIYRAPRRIAALTVTPTVAPTVSQLTKGLLPEVDRVAPRQRPQVLRRGAFNSSWCYSSAAVAQYVFRWQVRDTGWRVLTALGALNVAVHAYADSRGIQSATALAQIVEITLLEHSRIFLILLATIYAGEIVWRERDDRSAEVFAVQPVSDAALIAGKIAGVVWAQCIVLLALVVAVLCAVILAAGALPDLGYVLHVALANLLVPFVMWMLLALFVHAVVQQKVVGHLLCIGGWVFAIVVFDAALAAPNTVPIVVELPVGGSAIIAVWLVWVRGETANIQDRVVILRRRLRVG
jgi:ABC-2 type transport system permease protein